MPWGCSGAGFEASIVEAYPDGAALTSGVWLTVAVNGLEALRTFDLHRPVLEASFPSTSIDLCTGTGKRLGLAPLGGELADGTVTRTIKRAELYRVLAEQAQARGVRFVHGRRLASAEPRADGSVVARFEEGSEEVVDLLVGADGVHSTVRACIDPRAPAPRATQMGNVGGFASGVEGASSAPGEYRMIFGKRAFFGYVVAPSGEVWWFANPPVPYPAAPDAAWLASLFDEDVGPAVAVIRSSRGPLLFTGQHELPRVPRWHRGAMVILGDAAHAASPTSGQGASLAAEDGVALARCLRDLPIPEALAAFERERRDRVERVVREAARMSSQKIRGALGRAVRDLVLPFFLGLAAKESRDWLFTHRIAWTSTCALQGWSAG